MRPPDAPSGKILTHPEALAYSYIAVTFQLRSSINVYVRLTESSLVVCTKRSPKMEFWGDFGSRGEDIWWESTSVLNL